MKLYQININANSGSHGRIAEEIGQLVISKGWESYIAYGRWSNPSKSNLFRIGNMRDEKWHALNSRIFDNHGLLSKRSTRRLVEHISQVKPDIIHLHNIHGYYLNYPILFEYLSTINTPVVWTLHDCWSFTGHCAFFTYNQCDGYLSGCKKCRFLKTYPKSVLFNHSSENFDLKKKYFNSLNNLTLVPVSNWLFELTRRSMLGGNNIQMIHNGIDLQVFKPIEDEITTIPFDKKVVLGVSFDWDERKGLGDFVTMRKLLPDDYIIILVGLNKTQISKLPSGIIGIERTQSTLELAKYYSRANVFANPTYEDNFPTTNIESLACGTPVVTYETGGSPEAIDAKTGAVVKYGDVNEFCRRLQMVCEKKDEMSSFCRERAEQLYNKNDRYNDYFNLYQSLL